MATLLIIFRIEYADCLTFEEMGPVREEMWVKSGERGPGS